MIKASELRIGNFIFDDEGVIAKLIGFKPYDHSVRCDEEEGCDILIDLYPQDGKVRKGWAAESIAFNPIPLTPELLERCGFVKGSEAYFLNHKELTAMDFKATEYDGAWSVYLHSCNWKYSTRCFSLHQLQNLYFALTGEELIITLP